MRYSESFDRVNTPFFDFVFLKYKSLGTASDFQKKK